MLREDQMRPLLAREWNSDVLGILLRFYSSQMGRGSGWNICFGTLPQWDRDMMGREPASGVSDYIPDFPRFYAIYLRPGTGLGCESQAVSQFGVCFPGFRNGQHDSRFNLKPS